MKICFCGLGSIGVRHLMNLQLIAKELGVDAEIHGFRRTDRELDKSIKDCIAKQITEEWELDSDYDMVFITNPTSFHYDTIRVMANKTKNIFIEKPIFDGSAYHLSDLKLKQDGVYYVAGPLRYSGVIQWFKEFIGQEKIYSARVICSSYLPDWRSNTDYRQVYSAKKVLGGGVALDLIHEWDYICYLFGFPKNVYCISGKYSHLEIDSEDLAVYISGYPDMVIEIHLDYFGRIPKREIELFTENGTITGDLIDNTISFSDGRKQIYFEEGKDEIYLKEMRFFMGHVMNGQRFNNMQHCYSILKIALGEERI